ncbi:lipopolysaccharide biosynthesis protein [Frateuria hangzhouensis]|uniref:lipopolysaccharide biosynthesis protein n=1 Tax=Frateuria hangzhouensis TaxID=2995589 RepID=UPI002260B15A|nr:lipopolysaccharide biosynthesis protein [Frateuria sp. STR12]MCX7513949.1 lipopolysaccharide biosynthesis protein [Frateuria sp. STR12]
MNSIAYPKQDGLFSRLAQLTRRPFSRNVLAVTSGTAAAQVVTMVFAPVVARQYGPAAFGVLGVFMAALGVLAPVASLTYPIAMVLPRSDADAKGIAKLSLLIALVVAGVLMLAFGLAGDALANLLGLGTIRGYLMLLPLAVFLSAWMQVAEQWRIRKKQFKTTARVAVLQSVLINTGKVGIGSFHPFASVLVVLATLANGLYALMLGVGMRATLAADADEAPRRSLAQLARAHYDFPLYRAPQVCLNAASQSLPVLMLASFFGPAAAGFYALGRTVMSVPIRLIGKSVGDVFYPRFTEAAHQGQPLDSLILKATGFLAAAGLVPFAAVVALGPWLFALVFGQDWRVAGEYARWLAIWLYFGFLNRPSVAAIATLGMQRFFLGFEVVSVALRAAVIWGAFHWFHSDMLAVAAFCIVGALLNAFLVAATIVACRNASTAAGAVTQQAAR